MRASFDLTRLATDDKEAVILWKEFAEIFDLDSIEGTMLVEEHDFYEDGIRTWVWESLSEDLTIAMSNNPLTGEFRIKGDREIDKGYCSYIALEGYADIVEEVIEWFEENAEFIKEIDREGFSFAGIPERVA